MAPLRTASTTTALRRAIQRLVSGEGSSRTEAPARRQDLVSAQIVQCCVLVHDVRVNQKILKNSKRESMNRACNSSDDERSRLRSVPASSAGGSSIGCGKPASCREVLQAPNCSGTP